MASNTEGTGVLSTSDTATLSIKKLLAYYRLDTDGSDSSGNGYHGAITGTGLSFTTGGGGMKDEAMNLTSTLAHIFVSGIQDKINGNTELSMSAWIKSNDANGNKGFIALHSPHGGDDGGMRYDNNGTDNVLKIGIRVSGVEHAVETSFGSQTTEWSHVVMTWKSGSNIKVYFNGEPDVLSEVTNASNNTGLLSHYDGLYIGLGGKDQLDSTGDENELGWNGLIDEVKIYNFELSAVQVATLSNEISGEPVCMTPVPLDTNGDCIQNLEEFVEWAASFLECGQVEAGGCIEPVSIP